MKIVDTETKMYIDNEIEKVVMEAEKVFAHIRDDMKDVQKRLRDLED